MANPPDWERIREEILIASQRAIEWYRCEHAQESCSYFGYQAIPGAGAVYLGFDTAKNSVARMRLRASYVAEQIRLVPDRPKGPYGAHFMLTTQHWFPLIQQPNMFMDLAYQCVESLNFSELPEYSDTEDYPKRKTGGAWVEDDYTEANLCGCFWWAVDELERRHAFEVLPRASIFVVGYSYFAQTPVTLRVYA